MRKLRARYLLIVVLFIVVGPVVWHQAFPGESRRYDGVTLDQVEYTEVGFRNSAQDIDLAGMLFLPEGAGPFPAAVIIHGSGTSNRQNRWYLTLARHLQVSGIAVLLPDKRGSEKSGGDWRMADFEDLATDTLAAVEYMLDRDEVSSVGIIGMSQGGWIAPIVARESGDIAFVVSMVGAAVTPNEQLLFEEDHNLRQMGFLPGISYAIALMSTQYVRHVRWPQFYYRDGDYDPMALWQNIEIDTLVLLGSEDTNVPSWESAERFEKLGNDSINVIVFEGSGHALQDPPGDGDDLIRREALAAIGTFILEVN